MPVSTNCDFYFMKVGNAMILMWHAMKLECQQQNLQQQNRQQQQQQKQQIAQQMYPQINQAMGEHRLLHRQSTIQVIPTTALEYHF